MTKFVETVDYLLTKSPAGYKLAKILAWNVWSMAIGCSTVCTFRDYDRKQKHEDQGFIFFAFSEVAQDNPFRQLSAGFLNSDS